MRILEIEIKFWHFRVSVKKKNVLGEYVLIVFSTNQKNPKNIFLGQ